MSTLYSKGHGSNVVSFGTATRIVLGMGYSPLFVNAVETFVRSSCNLVKAAPDLKWFAKCIPNTALSLLRGELGKAKCDQIRNENAFKRGVGKELYKLLGSKQSTWTKASVNDIQAWMAGPNDENKRALSAKGMTPSTSIKVLREIQKLSQEQLFTGVYLPTRAGIAEDIEKLKESKPARTNADIKATKVRKSEIFRNFVWMGVSLGTALLTSQDQLIKLVTSRFTDQASFAASIFNSTLPVSTAACEEIAQNAGIISSLTGFGFNVLSSSLINAIPMFYAWNVYSEHSTGGWRQSIPAINSYLAFDALWANTLPISLFGGIAQTFGFFTTYDIETAGKLTMCAPLVATVALKSMGSLIMGKGLGGKISGVISSSVESVIGANNVKAVMGAMSASYSYAGLGKGSEILASALVRGWNCTMLSNLPATAAV